MHDNKPKKLREINCLYWYFHHATKYDTTLYIIKWLISSFIVLLSYFIIIHGEFYMNVSNIFWTEWYKMRRYNAGSTAGIADEHHSQHIPSHVLEWASFCFTSKSS